MLVLSRNTSERIQIGDNIFITVVRIGPSTVRLGIDAPPEVNIVRTELLADEPNDELPIERSKHNE